MDGMNVKSLEERSEGDVASPSSTSTQVLKHAYILTTVDWKIQSPVTTLGPNKHNILSTVVVVIQSYL